MKNLHKAEIKKQMLKAITKCTLTNTFCAYSTPTLCLTPRECEFKKSMGVGFLERKK